MNTLEAMYQKDNKTDLGVGFDVSGMSERIICSLAKGQLPSRVEHNEHTIVAYLSGVNTNKREECWELKVVITRRLRIKIE